MFQKLHNVTFVLSDLRPLTTAHLLSWAFASIQTLKCWFGTHIVFSCYGWMPACSVYPFLTLTYSWLLFFQAQFIICWESAERADGTVSGSSQWLPGGGWRRARLEGVARRLQGRQSRFFFILLLLGYIMLHYGPASNIHKANTRKKSLNRGKNGFGTRTGR